MEMAAMVANWSKDPDKQVGAVVVNQENRVMAVGFNGFARGVEDTPERLFDKPTKLALMLHAEDNAIEQATKLWTGADAMCTLYVYPCPPCAACANRIVRAGFVGRVVCPTVNLQEENSSWTAQQLMAQSILTEVGIACEGLDI